MTETADAARLDELTGRVRSLAAELAGLIATTAAVSGTRAVVSGTTGSAPAGGAGPGTFGEARAARNAGANSASDTASDVRSGVGVDVARVSQLAALEVLKSAVCAVQARVTADFADSQRKSQVQAGVPGPRAGRGIPSQIGLARRESPNKGQFLLGLSRSLVEEMPCTLAALARGELNEWRATLIVRETAVLSREHRAAADRERCGPSGSDGQDDPGGQGCPAASMGDAAISRAARAIGQRLDPAAAWKRAQKAQRGRCVTIRPAPDCMVRLTALLPVVQGVGVYAALCEACNHAKQAPGWEQTADEESGQIGQVITTTPAGHQYASNPPSPPGRPNSPVIPGRQSAAA